MTAQPPFDPGAYRSDAVPSDTQAIYIQEGGAEPRGILFHSPTKHPEDSASAGDYDCLRAALLDPRCYFLVRTG